MGGNKKSFCGTNMLVSASCPLQKDILQTPFCLSVLHIWMLKLSEHWYLSPLGPLNENISYNFAFVVADVSNQV